MPAADFGGRRAIAYSLGKVTAEEVDLVPQQVLVGGFVADSVRGTGQRQYLVRPPGGQQGGGQAQHIRREHVVVCQPVDQQQRAGQVRRLAGQVRDIITALLGR